jgi:hypothetical protein
MRRRPPDLRAPAVAMAAAGDFVAARRFRTGGLQGLRRAGGERNGGTKRQWLALSDAGTEGKGRF